MTTPPEPFRELDHRVSGGIDISLLWNPSTDEIHIAVLDTKRGEAFEVPVLPGQRALDVFHHPYAYAAPTAPRPERSVASSATRRSGSC